MKTQHLSYTQLSLQSTFFSALVQLNLLYIVFGSSSVFRKVENFWYRIEAQNRSALHIHGMLWLEGEASVDTVVAEKPRGENCKILRDLVVKYQLHSCRPIICFRTKNVNASRTCKYGFPCSCRENDG
jgi:hypothetical protein